MNMLKISHPLIFLVIFFFAFAVALEAEASVKIKHKPVKSTSSGHRIDVTAKVKDADNGINIVRLYFKGAEAERFYFVAMRKMQGDAYQATLPAPALGSKKFEYLILVKNGADEVVKSQNYSVTVIDDPAALKRLNEKPARDLHVEVACEELDAKQALSDLKSEIKKKTDDKKTKSEETDEPEQKVRVPVCSEYASPPTSIAGFDDYISVASVDSSVKLGVDAGIIDQQLAGAYSATGVVNAGTVAATAGIGMGTAIGIGAAIAVGAAAVSSGGGGSGGGSSGSSPPVACNTTQTAGGNAPETRVVELGKSSGTFDFNYEMFGIKDRMIVAYEGTQLLDTGCVSGGATVSLTYGPGSATTISVQVIPNCEATTGTSWNFTVNCPP